MIEKIVTENGEVVEDTNDDEDFVLPVERQCNIGDDVPCESCE